MGILEGWGHGRVAIVPAPQRGSEGLLLQEHNSGGMMRIWLSVLALMLLSSSALAADAPMELWLYYSNNFQANENNQKLEGIWRRAAKAGYTKILLTDSKFAKLGDLGGMERQYFSNVEKAKKLAGGLKKEMGRARFEMGVLNIETWAETK